MIKYLIRVIYGVALIVLSTPNLKSITIGSDFTLQTHIIFTGGDNRIAHDAKMENGFSLQDSTVSCSFDSFFPVKGVLSLQGGSLYLNRDFPCNSHFNFGSAGKIYGQGYSIETPNSSGKKNFPCPRCAKTLSSVTNIDPGDTTHSLDWSYDDNYIAVACDKNPSQEFKIFYFDGSTLTTTNSVELGDDTFSVQWHPSDYYVVIGRASGSGAELYLYHLNISNGTLTQKNAIELGTDVNAVAWSPDGNYVAVASTDDNLRIYQFSGGTLSTPPLTTISFAGHGTISKNALTWKSTGDYLAIGTTATGSDLLVYYFNGATLTLNASLDVSATGDVESVSWRPTNSIIAVGLSGTSYNIRIFEHYPSGSIVEKTAGRVTESLDIYSVDWDPSGSYLIAGREFGSGYELFLYYFDMVDCALYNLDNKNIASDVNICRFSHNSDHIAIGELTTNIIVYKMDVTQAPCLLQDTTFILNSDFQLNTNTTCEGCLCINGQGNKFFVGCDGILNIADNSTLTIQNAEVMGLKSTNIRCLTDNASLVLENCKLTLSSDYQFHTGSISFKQDVFISGTNKFVYSSTMTSTINQHSTLYLSPELTFSYAPTTTNRNLIYMTDNSSWFFLDGCTLFSTKTGLRITRGKLFMDNQVTLHSQGNLSCEAICFGDGIIENNLDVILLSAAQVNVFGRLEYENTD